MNFQHSAVIAAPKAKVWALLMDVPTVSQCVPGVQDVKPVDGKTYAGTLKMRVGPIALALAGNIVLEQQDEAAGQATMSAQARDPKVGGAVSARMEMLLAERSDNEAELNIATNANVLGKLGEFGQPVIKKKVEQMMAQFTDNLKKRLEGTA